MKSAVKWKLVGRSLPRVLSLMELLRNCGLARVPWWGRNNSTEVHVQDRIRVRIVVASMEGLTDRSEEKSADVFAQDSCT